MKTSTAQPSTLRSVWTGALLAGALFGLAPPAGAAEWSDTYIGYRYGTKFAEPFITQDVTKNIVNFSHASGYKYGINFFNVDLLMSDGSDPASCANFICSGDAHEAYVVYRNTVDLSKVTGGDYKWGWIRGWGGTFGFDWNSKTDAGYNSKKRMLVLGPTAMFDVPGFLNVTLAALWESNAPCTTFPVPAGTSACVSRYTYDTHAALLWAWSIPIGDWPLAFEGYMNNIASKGRNEFGGSTKPEQNFDGQIMLDAGRVMGGPKGMFKVGFEYQWWKNKFGNDSSVPFPTGAGGGAFAKTPMIRAEYHF